MWLMWLVSSAGMPWAEAVVSIAGRLADREIGGGARGWRGAFEARQRGANQRPVHRALIVRRRCLGIARSGLWNGLLSRLLRFGRGRLDLR
jgi:hypothetical protein